MSFGFGVLRLSPADFWAMTPVELAAAASGLYGDGASKGAPDLQDLAGLMSRFPDEQAG